MTNHPEEKYNEIAADLQDLGYDFRIVDLDESLQVRINDRWELMTDTLAAVIEMDMYEFGYGTKKKPSLKMVKNAMFKRGHLKRHHPIKAYFETLPIYTPKSDGYYVIKDLSDYFTNPDGWFHRWLFRWMVGAIAKVFEQTRNPMLVLSGPQDIGKSYFVKWLCSALPDNFMKQAINPDDKDAELRLSDTFIWEVDELPNTTTRANSEALKSFLTLPFIKRRAAYGRYLTYKPAITSFIGTANFDGAGFLNDPTGTTRFLTCEITKIDFQYDKEISLEHVWAEAYYYYRNLYRSWELTAEEKAQRDEINSRYEIAQPLVDAIYHHFTITHDPADIMTAYDIKQQLTGFYRINSEAGFYNELGRALRKIGLDKRRAAFKSGEGHHWLWEGIKKMVDDETSL
jgi:predicted P-loop ATPase